MSLTPEDLNQIRGVVREVVREEVPPIVRLEVSKQIAPLREDVGELKLDMAWVKEKFAELDRDMNRGFEDNQKAIVNAQESLSDLKSEMNRGFEDNQKAIVKRAEDFEKHLADEVSFMRKSPEPNR